MRGRECGCKGRKGVVGMEKGGGSGYEGWGKEKAGCKIGWQ